MAKTKIDDPSGVTIPAITATPEADFMRKMVELKARSLNALEDALTQSVLERARRDMEPKPKKRSPKRATKGAAVRDVLLEVFGAQEPNGFGNYGYREVNERLKATGRASVSEATVKRAWLKLYRRG